MLPNWYNDYKNKIDLSINDFLDEYFSGLQNQELSNFSDSVYYAIKGGKRIRSILALEFYSLFSKKSVDTINIDDDIMKLCIAIELSHAYSLVHDDLPCMDNDEYRRGELTVWKKYGETHAVLVGDLLNSLSFEILGSIKNTQYLGILLQMFGNSIGIYGMLGGQVLDIEYETNNNLLDLEKLIETHNKKTGRLISFSILGAILLSGNEEKVAEYADFGKNIGLAFQIKDDLLDVEGSFEQTGKSVAKNSHEYEQKGFVHFLGLKDTKKYLEEVTEKSLKNIENLESQKLNFLVNYIATRSK